MVREIVRDEKLLSQISEKATIDDIDIATDLFDTLTANAGGCVGMAANMIGELKRIIIVDDNDNYIIMFNPVILKKSDVYETNEGCLSLEGLRATRRYKKIKVEYQNEKMQRRIKTFTDFTAQIIQHEIDHCNGIVI